MKYKHEFAIMHMPYFLMGCLVTLMGLGLVVYGFTQLNGGLISGISPSLVIFLGMSVWIISGAIFTNGIEYTATLNTPKVIPPEASSNTLHFAETIKIDGMSKSMVGDPTDGRSKGPFSE